MRFSRSFGWLLAAGAGALGAQMHKVAKPETVVRAVGVYEWTGDMAKPTASRLIPVTLYINQHLEDAGLYLASPVPFALQTGNVYELELSGVPKGDLDLSYARHLQAANAAQDYDDGWFGYGSFKSLPTPKKLPTRKLAPARTSGIETAAADVDPDKPHFVNKAGQPVTPGPPEAGKPDIGKAADTPVEDPDRPHLTRKDTSTADNQPGNPKDTAPGSDAKTTPAGDPERPTMKRRGGNETADTSSTTSTASVPGADDDPDRPTLKRRSPEEAKKRASESQSTVTGTGSLNDDPDRPNLHRGRPAGTMTEADLPKLAGLPIDLRQMVAVSDAANRPVHDFERAWEDDAERAAVLGKMQAMARAQLAAYAVTSPTPAPRPAARPTAARPDSKRRALSPVKIVATPLLNEELRGYLLSYGDVPTFVYQAHTDGTGADLRYITLVAQRDAQGEPKIVLHVVTDAAHLDRTARLRLVDAVDVDASNRASLLFEMREQTTRQFSVYRVLGLQAAQIFATGTTQ